MIGTFESCFQLIFDSLQVLDMAGGSIKEIDFAGLLVRCRQGFLEACVTFPELVASSLL
jgi:hypothetical protein